MREKGRHEVKRIHLGVGRGDPGHSRAVTGTREVTQLGQKKVGGRESPFPLRYRLGTLYAEGLPVGGLQMDLFTPAQRFPQIKLANKIENQPTNQPTTKIKLAS